MEETRSLVDAVSAKDLSHLKEVLQGKDEANEQNQINDALMLAVKTKQTQMVEELLNAGADVNAFDDSNPISLTAIDMQALDIFELLVPKIKDVNISGVSGNMMHAAARTGDVAIIERVFNLGVDVNDVTITGATPLHEAVKKCGKNDTDLSAIQFLVSHVSDVDAKDDDQKTALHEASIVGNEKVVQCLLDSGADTNNYDETETAPFMYALQHDHGEDLADILTRDINLHISVVDQITYTHMACRSGNYKTLEYLMEKGVDMTLKDHDFTPLMIAIDSGHEECVLTILRGYPGMIDETTDYGTTALEMLLQPNGNKFPHLDKILKEMVSAGADINRVNPKTGYTPLISHLDCKTTGIVLGLGADINFASENGENGLLQACVDEEPEILSLLMHHNISMELSDQVMTEEDEESRLNEHDMTAIQVTILKENHEMTVMLLCGDCSLRDEGGWMEQSEHCDMLRKHDPFYQKVFAYIDSRKHCPSSLQSLSRRSILEALGPSPADNIDQLPLPEKVRDFLHWTKYYAYRKNLLGFNV